MPSGLDASSIARFHDLALSGQRGSDGAAAGHNEAWPWIEANHRCNRLLWREEDKARRTDVGADAIAASKRLIDRHNQQRNDAVEAIDEAILAQLGAVPRRPGARLSSETAGAMIDRLSILALKIFHMREQTGRADAGARHVAACHSKLGRLIEQRCDLARCLDRLLAEAAVGRAYFKLYRQFKMYNDPALNPYLYGRVTPPVPDGLPGGAVNDAIDVLVPTCNRACALAMTLTSLSAQTVRAMRILVSDQSDGAGVLEQPEVLAVLRLLSASGRTVRTWRHLPRRGMAEQRAFLLSQASAPYCLFLDDDVLLENDLIERLQCTMAEQQCGFVGSALHGLSYLDTVRPHQQEIEFWERPVAPEFVAPGSAQWERHHLHSAANLFHVQQKLGLTRATARPYRVAWVGGCVLFDTAKLRAAGGFDFWPALPPDHCGEDVLAQLRVMERFGGCGLIPSGAYHMELPTTIRARRVDAPRVLWPRPGAPAALHDEPAGGRE